MPQTLHSQRAKKCSEQTRWRRCAEASPGPRRTVRTQGSGSTAVGVRGSPLPGASGSVAGAAQSRSAGFGSSQQCSRVGVGVGVGDWAGTQREPDRDSTRPRCLEPGDLGRRKCSGLNPQAAQPQRRGTAGAPVSLAADGPPFPCRPRLKLVPDPGTPPRGEYSRWWLGLGVVRLFIFLGRCAGCQRLRSPAELY